MFLLQPVQSQHTMDPFDSTEFNSQFSAILYNIPATVLRVKMRAKASITEAKNAELQALEARKGQASHNEALLRLLTPGGKAGFLILREAIVEIHNDDPKNKAIADIVTVLNSLKL